MTTSWAYFTQGEWLASAQANVAGFLLAWFSLAVTVIAVRSVVTGYPPSIRIQQVATLSGVAIMVVAFMNWGWRLMA
jgi:membrane protein implicated in regulation of membrane protease activity